MQVARESIYVIGAGQAGCEIALGLRQSGFTGALALVGEESHPPYQRPPLSKAFLQANTDPRALLLRQVTAYERAGIELLLGTRVEHIDRHARTIALSNGDTRRFTRLALATGGRARKLTLEDAQRAERTGQLHYLRTAEDALRIRASFARSSRLVVGGGGYIGLEVAAAAITRGLHVTVLEAASRVLERVTAPDVSAFYESVHREAGVDVRVGTQLSGFEFDVSGNVLNGVACSDGSIIAADCVVVGIGLLPNTELAQSAGLAVDDGILVDQHMRTSDQHIAAAGDCANHPSQVYARRVRLESVPNAIEQARTAVATLMGKQRPYDCVPWFWSDQYDLKLQIAGLSIGHDQIVLRGSTTAKSFAVFYLRGGQLLACHAVNRQQEFIRSKRLVATRCIVDADRLADESLLISEAVTSQP